MKKFIRGLVAEIEIKTLLVSLLFIISLFVFGYLAHEIVGENETAFDEKAFHFFAGFSSPGFITINRILTFFGASYFSISRVHYFIDHLVSQRKKNRWDQHSHHCCYQLCTNVWIERIFSSQKTRSSIDQDT